MHVWRTCLIAICIVTSTFAMTPAARTQDRGISALPNQVRGDEITPQQKIAVQRGLSGLANEMRFGPGALGGYSGHAGITALAGLAFMEAGNLPGRGKYAAQVQFCLDYLLANCQDSGLIASDMSQGPMYGHGFATLFLAEIYGMTGDPAVREKLQKAVRLIERTQNPEGGWRYQPVPYDADISVTICQVMALRAARDAGIKVNKSVIDKAIGYVRECQNADGGFSYQPHDTIGSGYARSAAGVAALYYAGIFGGHDLQRGLFYLTSYGPRGAPHSRGTDSYFYGNYYATQVMFLAGGKYWSTFYPTIRDELIHTQQNGHWSGEVNDHYSTAMALIILQMPNRYLPVFAGKGPGS